MNGGFVEALVTLATEKGAGKGVRTTSRFWRGEEVMTLENLVKLFMNSLQWYWGLIHLRSPVPGGISERHQRARQQLLWGFAFLQLKMTPAAHYLTNHLFEDYERFVPLFFLMCEGGEASHARDKRRKNPTCRSRISRHDALNTWGYLLRNFYALKTMMMFGLAEM